MKLRNEYPQESFDGDKLTISVSPKDLVSFSYNCYGSNGLPIYKAREFINNNMVQTGDSND